MKKSFGEYQRAAGQGRYEGSLWLGSDHLLVIENHGFILPFSESYRRIDYRNIQALTIAKSARGKVQSALLIALVALLSWFIYLSYEENRSLSYFFGFLEVPLILALIIHWARGPTTVCRLQTAVQILTLRPLNRLRTAQRFLAQLQPLCGVHQPVDPLAGAETGGVPNLSAVSFGAKVKEPWQGSRLVTWALVLVLVSSVVSAGELFVKGMPYYFVDVSLSVAAIGLICASAAEINRYQSPPALRWSIWGNAALMLIGILVGYGLMFFTMVKGSIRGAKNSVTSTSAEINMWVEVANADISTYGSFSWVLIGMSALGFMLALIGLPSARAGAAVETPPTPPATPPPLSPS